MLGLSQYDISGHNSFYVLTAAIKIENDRIPSVYILIGFNLYSFM